MIFSSLLVASLCAQGKVTAAKSKKRPSSIANFHFSARLLKQVLLDENANVLISPFSINRSLLLAAEGSAGVTRKEFTKVLAPLHKIRWENETEFREANGFWGNRNFEPSQTYVAHLRAKYPGHSFNLHFPKQASEPRNQLTSTASFKGPWQFPFDKFATKAEPFFLQDQQSVEAQFMKSTETLVYGRNQLMQWVLLPLGQESRMQFLILLPQPGIKLATLIPQLTSRLFEKILNSERSLVQLSLPRFSFSYQVPLAPKLQNMGLKSAFHPRLANFSKLYDAIPSGPVYLEHVLHQTSINVNEYGLDATSASGVLPIVGSAMPREKLVVMEMNRPFLFFVLAASGTSRQILFAGYLSNPAI